MAADTAHSLILSREPVQKELINKRAIENLIKAGACDSLDGTRKQMAMVYASIVDRVQHDKKSTMAGR